MTILFNLRNSGHANSDVLQAVPQAIRPYSICMYPSMIIYKAMFVHVKNRGCVDLALVSMICADYNLNYERASKHVRYTSNHPNQAIGYSYMIFKNVRNANYHCLSLFNPGSYFLNQQ